jgi:cell division transport system permease protein
MRHTVTQHLGIIRHALRRIFAAPLTGILNIMVIGIAISLPMGMYVIQQNTQTIIDDFSDTPQISLFLKMNAKTADVKVLQKKLDQHTAISHVDFVPRDQALQQLNSTTGLADLTEGLKENPLPDAFIVYPKPGLAQSLDTLRTALAKLEKVEHAQLDSDWAYKLEALLGFARIAILILASLLSLALVAITFNTIRLQVLTQRDEIEVAKLIGATDSFIRRPFLYFGMLQGLLGGITAWLIITVSLLLLNQQLTTLSQLYTGQFVLHQMSIGDSLSLLAFSMYLGWLGASLSVSRHLSQIEPR